MNIIRNFETQVGVRVVGEVEIEETKSIIPIYEIPSFHLLTQFVGYGKYINSKEGNVVLRGQNKIYKKGLIPSLYRAIRKEAVEHRLALYKGRRNRISRETRNFHGMNSEILDSLLQHYGMKTYWLDVIDNLWVAIWFATHDFNSIVVEDRQHVHVSSCDDNDFGYIYLLCSDATICDENIPGVYRGNITRLVDLRKGVASIYLRPHAQHALMLGKKIETECYSYNDLIIGIARISVRDGLNWIGRDGLMSIQSLFPPTYFDKGYVQLLEQFKLSRDEINDWGSIQIISY